MGYKYERDGDIRLRKQETKVEYKGYVQERSDFSSDEESDTSVHKLDPSVSHTNTNEDSFTS